MSNCRKCENIFIKEKDAVIYNSEGKQVLTDTMNCSKMDKEVFIMHLDKTSAINSNDGICDKFKNNTYWPDEHPKHKQNKEDKLNG